MIMSPGAYLRKRREAAGISLEQAAVCLVTLPISIGYSRVRVAALAARLAQLEADADVLSPAQAMLLRRAWPFDDDIYEQLVALHYAGEGQGLPEPRLCRQCGCSWNDACVTASGPCAWSDDDPALCTACERKADPFPHMHRPASSVVIEGIMS